MLRRSMTKEQVELLRQQYRKNSMIELKERRGLTGKIIAVEVEFYKASVGTAYRNGFVKDINTSRSRQLDEIADDITSLLYMRREKDNAPAEVGKKAYAGET